MLRIFVPAFLIMLAPSFAFACCSYGCCDCSCVTSVPTPIAKQVVEQLQAVLRGAGIEPQVVDLVIKTKSGTIVLQCNDKNLVLQPKQ